MRILLINGPNLNLLGRREPSVYGNQILSEINDDLIRYGKAKEIEITARQSNHEGEIIDWIQQAVIGDETFDGLIINPGAHTHYSIAIRDAISGVAIPAVEVHLSDIHTREPFRSVSVIAPVCLGQIAGLGAKGYQQAIDQLITHLQKQ